MKNDNPLKNTRAEKLVELIQKHAKDHDFVLEADEVRKVSVDDNRPNLVTIKLTHVAQQDENSPQIIKAFEALQENVNKPCFVSGNKSITADANALKSTTSINKFIGELDNFTNEAINLLLGHHKAPSREESKNIENYRKNPLSTQDSGISDKNSRGGR
jgi:hypothetical protein